MLIRVRGLDFIDGPEGNVTDVNVRFSSILEDGSNIGGFIRVTKAEYDAHSDLTDLGNLLFVKLKEKVNANG